MKSLTSAAFAAALAVSTVAVTANPAAAGGSHHPHTNFGAALAAGAFLGLAFGALATPRYTPPPYPYTYSYAYPYPYTYAPVMPPPPVAYPRLSAAQIAWCRSHYPWYDAATNTWVDQYGIRRTCIVQYGPAG